MRGRRRSLATVLADALPPLPAARQALLSACFASSCGPRLAREASVRGITKDGRLLVLVRTEAWAAQVRAAAPILCQRLNERLGPGTLAGIDVRVASEP